MENETAVDAITMYLQELETVAPLADGEKAQLFRTLGGSGDWNEEQENAARRLIETHLKLVVSVAEKYLSSGMPMLDLVQEGNLGLMNAVRSFAEKPEGEFFTFATTRIEESIANAIAKR